MVARNRGLLPTHYLYIERNLKAVAVLLCGLGTDGMPRQLAVVRIMKCTLRGSAVERIYRAILYQITEPKTKGGTDTTRCEHYCCIVRM